MRAEAQEGAPRRLGALAVVHPGLRVDVPVHHECPDPVREQVRVRRSEQRAVRDAPVAQSVVARCPAQQVEIACGVGGRDVAQQLRVPPLAPLRQIGVRGDVRPLLLPADRERRDLLLPGLRLGGAVEAAHRRAVADAARVPADDVEAVPELRRELAVQPGQSDGPGATGPARVEEQRSLGAPRAGRPVADHRQVDRPARGVRMVQGHLCHRAFEFRPCLLRARPPVQYDAFVAAVRAAGRRGAAADSSARRAPASALAAPRNGVDMPVVRIAGPFRGRGTARAVSAGLVCHDIGGRHSGQPARVRTGPGVLGTQPRRVRRLRSSPYAFGDHVRYAEGCRASRSARRGLRRSGSHPAGGCPGRRVAAAGPCRSRRPAPTAGPRWGRPACPERSGRPTAAPRRGP